MFPPISRRRFLATAAALGTSRFSVAHADATTRAAATALIAGRRTIDVRGKPASVFGIQQSNGVPGLTLRAGQSFQVRLENQADEPTIVHWHGQTPPADQDGVVDTGLASLIVQGSSHAYDFLPRAGTHWMHSHHGLQEQLLMAAPLIVHTETDIREDMQEVVVLLHDFTFRPASQVLAELAPASAMARHGMAMPAPQTGMAMAGHAMPMSGTADLNDVDYDAYLANDRTLDDPLVVRTERGGRVRLRLINGASSTAFWIDLGALDGTLIAVDGDAVRPVTARRLPITEAQRLDIMVRLPSGGGSFPVLAQREGDRQRTGIILATPGATVAKLTGQAGEAVPALDLTLERRLMAATPLTQRRVDVVHRVVLTGTMQPYVWSINGRSWANHQPLQVRSGQRVALQFLNNTTMAHPMHLHGHHFQVVAIDGNPIDGAMRDTVLVPPEGTVTVAFDADNPGRWLLHCHNLYHMATGMMTEVAYQQT